MALPALQQSRRRTRPYDLNDSNIAQIAAAMEAELDGKAPLVHTHTSTDISDSTAAGRALLVAADAAAQRAALGVTRVTAGIAVLNFGALPGSGLAETVVTGQTGITTAARVRAWLQGDSTADFNTYEHTRVFPSRIGLAVTDIVAGTGFTIIAETELRLAGTVKCRWEWSE